MSWKDIEVTSSPRGFEVYGSGVRCTYGDTVEVYESSSAEGPHVWLRIHNEDGSSVHRRVSGDMSAHLNLEQAIAVRDRLNAFIKGSPARWGSQ